MSSLLLLRWPQINKSCLICILYSQKNVVLQKMQLFVHLWRVGTMSGSSLLAAVSGHQMEKSSWTFWTSHLSWTSLQSSPAPLPPIFSAVLFEPCAWLSNKTAETPEIKFPSGNLCSLQNFSRGWFHWWKPWWWLWYSSALRPPRNSELLCDCHFLNTQWEGEWLRWVTPKSFTALLTWHGHNQKLILITSNHSLPKCPNIRNVFE